MSSEKALLRKFLLRHVRHHKLLDDEDIFASGYVNSLFAMQLVLFVEKEFEIKVGNEDLNLDNFRTINAMTSLVERRKSASSEP